MSISQLLRTQYIDVYMHLLTIQAGIDAGIYATAIGCFAVTCF